MKIQIVDKTFTLNVFLLKVEITFKNIQINQFQKIIIREFKIQINFIIGFKIQIYIIF